jgi:hypothetical protein
MKANLIPLASSAQRQLIELGGPKLTRAADNAIRRGSRRIVTRAIKEFQSRAIGRSLFVGAKGRKAARALIKAERVSGVGGLRVVEIVAKGLAGIQEHGGRIGNHPIEPKGGGLLAFSGPEGLAFARHVDHPGGTLAAFPVIANAIAAETSKIGADIDAVITKHFDDTTGR